MAHSTSPLTVLTDRLAKHVTLWRLIWNTLPVGLAAWCVLQDEHAALPKLGLGFYFALLTAGWFVGWVQAYVGNYSAKSVEYLSLGDRYDLRVASDMRRFLEMRLLGLIGLGAAALAAGLSPYPLVPVAFVALASLTREARWIARGR